MVRNLFALTLCTIFLSAHGQRRLSPATRMLVAEYENLVARHAPASDRDHLQHRYDLLTLNGTAYGQVVLLVDDACFNAAALENLGARIGSHGRGYITALVPVQHLRLAGDLPGVRQVHTAADADPWLEHSRRDTRSDSVNLGLGGLDQAYMGQGVVVAVIDWGFDYTHPVFRNADQSGLRISRAWDQNKQAGPAPAGYTYGTEYNGAAELLAAQADTVYVFGPLSHGTHVAGIAAGNGAGTTHVGMAPDAELILISLRRTDASFIDAIHYVAEHAAQVGKPFVVNMSFGGHLGPHDGTDPRNVAMDQLIGPGRVFVGSAGNNGTGNFHLMRDATPGPDTLRTTVAFGSHAEHWGQTIPVWGATGGSFALRVRLLNGSNQELHASPWYHTADEPSVNDTVLVTGASLITRIETEAASPWNGKPNMLLKLRRTGSAKVVLEVASPAGGLHLWNVMELQNRTTNWSTAFTSEVPGTVAGDNNYGVAEPAGVGPSVITCASHRAEQFSGGGEMLFGYLSNFSSRGPTVDGRTKPDISAPGEQVRSAVSRFDPGQANAPQTVEFEGHAYPFQTFSGTSMSGPAVAGVVALMLQAEPTLDAVQVKSILRATARLDQRTGPIGPEGTLSWGWGKVNALAAVLAARAIVSTPEIDAEPDDVTVYPNPTDGDLRIGGMDVLRVRLHSATGAMVLEQGVVPGAGDVLVTMSGLPAGVYLAEITGRARTVFRRVVLR